MKELNVGKLRSIIKDIPDDVVVKLSSDSGVDKGIGTGVIVEDAYHVNKVKNGIKTEYLSIYANADYSSENISDDLLDDY